LLLLLPAAVVAQVERRVVLVRPLIQYTPLVITRIPDGLVERSVRPDRPTRAPVGRTAAVLGAAVEAAVLGAPAAVGFSRAWVEKVQFAAISRIAVAAPMRRGVIAPTLEYRVAAVVGVHRVGLVVPAPVRVLVVPVAKQLH
jgi:hypothetical protein